MKTETDIGKRWEDGTDHHPKSEKLYKLISQIDYLLQNDSLCLTAGGDGDNGEALMYCLDIIFDAEDNKETEELQELVHNLQTEKINRWKK